MDSVIVTALSQGDNSQIDTAALTTTADAVYGLSLSGDDSLSDLPGETVTYTVSITNDGNISDSYTLALSGNTWVSNLSQSTINLAAGTSATFQVSVVIPPDATNGEMDIVSVTATSQGDGSQMDTVDLTTTAEIEPPDDYTIFLPVVINNTGGTAVLHPASPSNQFLLLISQILGFGFLKKGIWVV